MSYCRWSSMNWGCDLYAYESCYGGFVLHLAGRRRERLPAPTMEEFFTELMEGDSDKAMEIYRAHHDDLGTIPLVDIDHPLAGESWHFADAEDAAEKVRELRTEGFVIPEGVEDEILEDAA